MARYIGRPMALLIYRLSPVMSVYNAHSSRSNLGSNWSCIVADQLNKDWCIESQVNDIL